MEKAFWVQARDAEYAWEAFDVVMEMIREMLSNAETPETKMTLLGLHGMVLAAKALSELQGEMRQLEESHKDAKSLPEEGT